MSQIKYGLVSSVDASVLERTIDLICGQFQDDVINVTEIGVYGGLTSKGIFDYVTSKMFYIDASGRNYSAGGGKPYKCSITGIDSLKDGETIRYFPAEGEVIIGNSTEVYNQLGDESQHLLFVDGDHSYIGVIGDFFAYKAKVKKGGFFCFHDTGEHIEKFKDFQHGDKENPDSYISVRKALGAIGLFQTMKVRAFQPAYTGNKEWELVFDEADTENPAGGITVFRKL